MALPVARLHAGCRLHDGLHRTDLSGKSAGKRIPRSIVLPLFRGPASLSPLALLLTFTFEMLALCTLLYLAMIPVSVVRYARLDVTHRKAEAARRSDGGCID